MGIESGPLPKKLPELHKEPEIVKAVNKHKRVSDERVSNTPEAKIAVYLNRLSNVFENPNEKQRERNVALIKPQLHEALVIKTSDVPESYFELQKRVARERGQELPEITPEMREEMIEVIQNDQKKSLDSWVDYLTSDDAVYPTWFKYFALRSITKLSQFDKERGAFKKRSKDTTATFPDIYREPLAKVADNLNAIASGDTSKFMVMDGEEEKIDTDSFKAYAEGRFADLYAREIQQTLLRKFESRETTEGSWVTYKQGDMSQAQKLYKSLEDKGTGWCTAGETTAQKQIEGGDFHVYYTFADDNAAAPTEPRLAVRMEGEDIGEVRGVLPDQEVEPILSQVLEAKLAEFGSRADEYKKKTEDMKRVTVLEKKIQAGEEPTTEDLRFLYEVDDSIEGFGYKKDPRIANLTRSRNLTEDLQRIIAADRLGSDSETYYFPYLSREPFIYQVLVNYDQFKNLDEDQFVRGAIYENNAHLVRKNADRLGISDEDLLQAYLEVGEASLLVREMNELEKIGATEQMIADAILERQPEAMPYFLHKFPSIEHKYIARRLIDNGHSKILFSNLSSFNKLGEDMALELITIDPTNSGAVARSLASFVETEYPFNGGTFLSNEFSLNLFKQLEKKDLKAFAGNLRYLKQISPEIADKLVEAEYITEVATSINQFETVTTEVAKKLIYAGYGREVARYQGKLSGSGEELALLLIDWGFENAVLVNISRGAYGTLSMQTYNRLNARGKTIPESAKQYFDLSETITT